MVNIKLIRSFSPPEEIFREHYFLIKKSRLVEKDATNLNGSAKSKSSVEQIRIRI